MKTCFFSFWIMQGPLRRGEKSVFLTSRCGGVINPVENLLGYQALFAWGLVGPNCLRSAQACEMGGSLHACEAGLG